MLPHLTRANYDLCSTSEEEKKKKKTFLWRWYTSSVVFISCLSGCGACVRWRCLSHNPRSNLVKAHIASAKQTQHMFLFFKCSFCWMDSNKQLASLLCFHTRPAISHRLTLPQKNIGRRIVHLHSGAGNGQRPIKAHYSLYSLRKKERDCTALLFMPKKRWTREIEKSVCVFEMLQIAGARAALR